MTHYDCVILGGGINGVGIAADAAGRGLKTLLIEKNDLASGTSSASSKLAHGGLRYLEHFQWSLVKESLKEREILLKRAPHLVQPLSFIIAHSPHHRPLWMLRLGLWFYSKLASKSPLASPTLLRFSSDNLNNPLDDRFQHGLKYSDCSVDDSRLVITNALAAAELGADILTHTTVEKITQETEQWQIDYQHQGEKQSVTASLLINACGPWVNDVSETLLNKSPSEQLLLSQGSHVVVPRFYEGEEAYVLQHSDQRIIFVIPYEKNFTLIGTTDKQLEGKLDTVCITQEEIEYLLTVVHSYFKNAPKKEDIVWEYSGVRALYEKRSSRLATASRESYISLEQEKAPLITLYGGKITTYRRLAEQVLKKCDALFPKTLKPTWTSNTPLPGGDIANMKKISSENETTLSLGTHQTIDPLYS